MRLLLSMGLRDGASPLRPCLRELDTDSGSVHTVWAAQPSVGLHPGPQEHAELTCAHVVGEHLVQTTRTEVLWIRLADRVVVERFSHPLLHDVHDAVPLADGGLAVTATGHDSVLIFGPDRALVRHHWLGGPGTFAEHYGGVSDFRQVPFDRYKPHRAHPNHLFVLNGQLYATCLALGRAVCLEDRNRALIVPDGSPHDGRWIQGLLWFTTVEGGVYAWSPETRTWTVKLAVQHNGAGWCRGVELADGRLFVGMTTLRGSRWRELGRNLVPGLPKKQPTRVLELDPASGRVIREWPVSDGRDGTLYSLHHVS